MKRAWMAVAGFALAACGGGRGDAIEGEFGHVTANLTPLASCGDVEMALRRAAMREMDRRLNQEMSNYLEYGGNCYYGDEDMASAVPGATSGAGGGTGIPSDPSAEGASQVSGTNNQVAGVSEADFVKNDDKYIYVVSDGAFRIIEAWPAPTAHEIARLPLEGTPQRLFVTNNRALIYSSISKTGSESPAYPGSYGGGECTYGYDCDFVGDGRATRITVLDLSDRAVPRRVREIDLSGSYINARRIGSAVHTVVHDVGVNFPDVSYRPTDIDTCDPDVTAHDVWRAFMNLRARNAAAIMTTPVTDWLPSVVDTSYDGLQPEVRANLLGSCGGFFDSPLGDGSGFITVLSVAIDENRALSTSTIVSRGGAVYASADSLFVSVRQQSHASNLWYPSMQGVEQASTVHKFNLLEGPPRAEYAASGVVKGYVLNQFSMDEHEDHLRIATTTGHVPSPDVHSTLTILGQRGIDLVPVGMVDGLAPTEDIRSVRFSGNRGFIVTFKKTDPLFVLDLENPNDPRVLAELKIPGFSTYMHMMDDTHLLTIGYDADDQGSFAWFTGVMLQIFDVSNPTQPSLMHKEIIGTRGSSSEALNNHLAFNYFAPKNLLSLPMTVCEGSSGGGSYGTTMTFSGLMVYDTTVGNGFHLRGQVAHPTDLATGGYDSAGCSNWWTNASSQVKRSIIMDDYVFSISETLIKINHLDLLDEDVGVLPIAE